MHRYYLLLFAIRIVPSQLTTPIAVDITAVNNSIDLLQRLFDDNQLIIHMIYILGYITQIVQSCYYLIHILICIYINKYPRASFVKCNISEKVDRLFLPDNLIEIVGIEVHHCRYWILLVISL